MRTRLDEIVEEELGRDTVMWASGADAIVAKYYAGIIAERAFRHGVEQGQTATIHATNFLDAVNPEEFSYRVQPAPAGEPKSAREYVMNAERLTREAWEAFHKGCAHGRCWCKPDRRKGERRKGLEKRLIGSASFGALLERTERLFCTCSVIGWGEWRDDRRSGKDRRK